MTFTWIPFYQELAQKLLQFRNNRKPLVDWIYANLQGYINHLKDAPDGRRVPDVDPFTVFAIINRSITYEKKIDICRKFKNYLNISTPDPEEFFGVPEMNNQRSNFIAFEDHRKEGDIERLWRLFEDAVLGKDIKNSYNALSKQRLIRFNITFGLFWIRPDKYLALDGNNQNLLESLGIFYDNSKFLPYDEYVEVMERLREKMKNESLGYTNFAEFSYKAYTNKRNNPTQITVENSSIINSLQDKPIIEKRDFQYQNVIQLLEANKNLILTGAPGTGKTYMAKAIAKEMGAEIGFVQFHPSYDYTDFVEGLRPQNTEEGFERRNGVFKEFCSRALRNLTDSKKTIEVLQNEKSAQEALGNFISDAIEKGERFTTSSTKNEFVIVADSDDSIHIEIPKNEKIKTIQVYKNDIIRLLESNEFFHSLSDVRRFNNRNYGTQQDSYVFVIYNKLKNKIVKKVLVETITQKPFVFIIDEINRGEISKIFGELFFSIDPGYRGEKGKVKTQYQNLIAESDVFKDGFYVPENVYIIGTMNDIDRSVESMDFAMRRRFAWKEVTAEESMEMLNDLPNAETIKNRMRNLNKAILEIHGLGKAYQIGAAYFKKIELYNGDFEKLWLYHLKGLLYEYLRGNNDADKQLKELKKAYDNETPKNEIANTDNGQ